MNDLLSQASRRTYRGMEPLACQLQKIVDKEAGPYDTIERLTVSTGSRILSVEEPCCFARTPHIVGRSATFSNFEKIDTVMSKILDYLNHLDKNADARDAHAADPASSMTNFGLSPDEQEALTSGSKQKVANAAGIAAEDLHALIVPQTPFD